MTAASARPGRSKALDSLTDVPGVTVGHAQDKLAVTGCTVVLCRNGAVGGVDQRGGAPGTRETDPLRPMHLVQQVHAVVLAGGSAFGLEAASGVVRWLEAQGVGFDVGVAKVPIVPAAILFDLGLGRADVRPTAEMGFAACQAATDRPVEQGSVGAGTGASVGKILGMAQAVKSGIGSASQRLENGLVVGALVSVNAMGDVLDPKTGAILAGARRPEAASGDDPFADTLEVMRRTASQRDMSFGQAENTVIGVVATNARLTKESANKVAQMAQDGVARCIRPAHTMVDGDTLFALATGEIDADVNLVGAMAAEVVADSILRAVRLASSLGGLPTAADLGV
jgi:L-aminopeptidase/D-esterase-like protein